MQPQDLLGPMQERIAALFGVPPGTLDWPADRNFLQETISADGRELDSLDLVEMLTAIEDDLEVSLLDVNDVDEVSTLSEVASLLVGTADPARLDTFIERWTPVALE